MSNAAFEQLFGQFCKFGDSKSDGKAITLTQSDKWMKQANIFGKKITTTDTGICFNKLKYKQVVGHNGCYVAFCVREKKLNFANFQTFVQDLAKYKDTKYEEIVGKLVAAGAPGTANTTQATHSGGVDRLTDTAKYTGAHKERFDAEGKGKGIAGREDKVDDAGYVTGYKGKDTYDKKK